jgi:uncharacterized protein YdeI (YjbR/CyaY-like superfamily)
MKEDMPGEKELPILSFPTASAWEAWLRKHHAETDGFWIKIAKKESGIASVGYEEALDEALCHGWIDGQKKPFDSEYYLQKFTPRRPKSLWSKRNIEKITVLTAAGRMSPAGLAEVEAAKRDGRWKAAYDSPKDMSVPEDFVKALEGDEKAQQFYRGLNRANLYAIAWRLATAKTPEARQRRFENLLAMIKRSEKLH